MSATEYHRIKLIGFYQRGFHCYFCVGDVVLGYIFVVGPFHYITENVIEAPWVWLLLAYIVRRVVAVVCVPGIFFQLVRVVAKEISSGLAGPGGIFPFSLGGQSVKYAR